MICLYGTRVIVIEKNGSLDSGAHIYNTSRNIRQIVARISFIFNVFVSVRSK